MCSKYVSGVTQLNELLKLWPQAALNIWLELGRVVPQVDGTSHTVSSPYINCKCYSGASFTVTDTAVELS